MLNKTDIAYNISLLLFSKIVQGEFRVSFHIHNKRDRLGFCPPHTCYQHTELYIHKMFTMFHVKPASLPLGMGLVGCTDAPLAVSSGDDTSFLDAPCGYRIKASFSKLYSLIKWKFKGNDFW